ncbi:hypothetical protein AX16_002041 [Volvariella volvacea WC 439]|nr:hypothetical protein AX16_002041 [Volvariella volvacea WC 439]
MVTANLISSPSHGSGYTCLAFSRDGIHAFTGGQDCVEDCWISGSADTQARRYLKSGNTLSDHVATGGALTIRCVAVDPRSKRVAVASDDLVVKLVNLDDTLLVTNLTGHTSSIRKVTWHPSGNMLTTCGSDGRIFAWDLSKPEPVLEKTIDGVIPIALDTESPAFSHDCSAVWHPSGEQFYAASRGHDIVTISRSNWSKIATFTDKNIGGAVTALAVSPNGAYLASASQSKIHIWSTETRKTVVTHDTHSNITINQLAFSPTSNLLAWTDEGGVFTRWIKPISDNLPSPFTPIPTASDPDEAADDLAEDADGMDIDLDAAIEGDDWFIDDTGTGLQDEPLPKEKKHQEYVKEMVSIAKAQAPFQPGSTPLHNKKRYLACNLLGAIDITEQGDHNVVNVEFFDKSARRGFHFTDDRKSDMGYLGERGAVFASPPEDGFPAQVVYKPYGTWAGQTEWSYTLRSGTRVLGVTAGGAPPRVKLRTDVDSDLEGSGHVVVATSEGDLTFLSGTGRERRVMGLGSEFVSMAAGSEWVFVVHRSGGVTIDGSQNLWYSLISFEDFSVLQRDVLPLQKGHTLKWIGITDQGAPATYDSAGHLHVLTKFRIPHHASWARLIDTKLLERRQGKDESYWPLGITGSTFMCFILKGKLEHPGFPRPLVQDLPIRMPFRRDEPKEELIERELLFIQTALDVLDDDLTTEEITSRERAMDKEFIQLIQQACKSENIPRAVELTKLLHFTNSFDSAAKIADFYHRPGFKEKVLRLKADREENEDRLIVARDKRRKWLKPELPPRRLPTMNEPWSGSSSARTYDPLADERPPPVVHRPGMARVTRGVVEESQYTSHNLQRQPRENPLSDLPSSQATVVPSSLAFPAPAPFSLGEGKRKRDSEEVHDNPEIAAPTPFKKPNPFARKAAVDTNRNPFARKPDQSKMIQKSESFFEKVDAAENEAKNKKPGPKGKEKQKQKEGPKQATLLGMMGSGASATGMKKDRQNSKLSGSIDAEETQLLETQMTDSSAVDSSTRAPSAEGSEETQPADGISTLEETQLIDQ